MCVQRISYSLLCRWFRAAVLPLDGALYAEIIPEPGQREAVHRVRGSICPEIQPGEILPGLRSADAPKARSRKAAEKASVIYAFRQSKRLNIVMVIRYTHYQIPSEMTAKFIEVSTPSKMA